MKSGRTRVAGALVIAVALTACSGHSRRAESDAVIPHSPGDLRNTQWVLAETGTSKAVPASTPMTLNIADGNASGNGPCNRYHLSFTHSGNDLTTGPVASTKIACAANLMNAEQTFFHSLEVADTIEKESELLVLSGPDDVRLVFERSKAAKKISGTWKIVDVAAKDALQSVVPGTSPTVDFADGGTLTIETGCNTGSSTWHADGNSLTIGPVRSTLKACADPPGLMDQEANIYAALPRTATVEMSATTAVLLDEAGLTVLVLERDS